MTVPCSAMVTGVLKGCVVEEKLSLKKPVNQGLTILIASAFTIISSSIDRLLATHFGVNVSCEESHAETFTSFVCFHALLRLS